MKKVLVTGASGCVGLPAVQLLRQRGWEVHAVGFTRSGSDLAEATWHACNLLNPLERRALLGRVRPQALIHAAWDISPGWAQGSRNFDWLEASLDLVRQFAAAGGTRVLAVGTCLEYDWDYGFCSESRTPCRPAGLYAAAKFALAQVLLAGAAELGLSAVWARLFFLYGPREHPQRLIPHVVTHLLRGEPARCSHGRQIRDYLYAPDAAEALVNLLESDFTGSINVASGQPISLRELVLTAARLLGEEALVEFGAVPASTIDRPLVVADCQLLEQTLGWRPSTGLQEGLEATILWWRGNLGGCA